MLTAWIQSKLHFKLRNSQR